MTVRVPVPIVTLLNPTIRPWSESPSTWRHQGPTAVALVHLRLLFLAVSLRLLLSLRWKAKRQLPPTPIWMKPFQQIATWIAPSQRKNRMNYRAMPPPPQLALTIHWIWSTAMNAAMWCRRPHLTSRYNRGAVRGIENCHGGGALIKLSLVARTVHWLLTGCLSGSWDSPWGPFLHHSPRSGATWSCSQHSGRKLIVLLFSVGVIEYYWRSNGLILSWCSSCCSFSLRWITRFLFFL